jgi:hypothetical protein
VETKQQQTMALWLKLVTLFLKQPYTEDEAVEERRKYMTGITH